MTSVKLAVLGGGGFRVPLVHGALLAGPPLVTHLALHDVDPARQRAVAAVLEQQQHESPAARPPHVTTSNDIEVTLRGADIVFSAIRVGGLSGRSVDERVALDLGVLGQETTGAGGIAYGLRTVPVALEISERIKRLAPHAWVVNFTNPAGLVTEAMQSVLGDRVIGICDSPIALARRAIHALGVPEDETDVDYVGLNHLGWLRALHHGGRDRLPDLLSRPELLDDFEEGRLFGPRWIAALGAIPNEYLYYYDFTREALAGIHQAGRTRGEFLAEQQSAFYAHVGAHPEAALDTWRRVHRERDATYMQEARAKDRPRAEADLAVGGYEGVALALMTGLLGGPTGQMILGVRNAGTIGGLPDDAVVEVTCRVDATGAHPVAAPPVSGWMLGLMQRVKAVERFVIEAGRTRSAKAALKAFALHPLVDSVSTAEALLAAYRHQVPDLADLA